MFFLHSSIWDSEEGNALLLQSPHENYAYICDLMTQPKSHFCEQF